MTEDSPSRPIARCPFCRMETELRLLRMPVCAICRDQLWDFVWVSGIQGMVVLAGGLSGFFFVAEEILLFGALVLVKHRVPVPWSEAS